MSTALVTGANRGIGLELVRQLRDRGDDVVAVVRRSSPELEATGARVESDVDVTDTAAVADLVDRIDGLTFDVVIQNAGVLIVDRLDGLDFDALRTQLEVNTLGPLRLTAALRHHVTSHGGKVALITSRMGSIDDNTSGGMYGYRMSKAALNMAGKSMSHDLRPLGISVAILHPGHVRTQMTRGSGLVDASESAAGLLARIDALTLETSGTFWHANGEELPW